MHLEKNLNSVVNCWKMMRGGAKENQFSLNILKGDISQHLRFFQFPIPPAAQTCSVWRIS